MRSLRALLTLCLCALLMAGGVPRSKASCGAEQGPAPTRSCCGSDCHCEPETRADQCPCRGPQPDAPRAPLPEAPRASLPAADQPLPEPVPETAGAAAAFAARCAWTPRFGIDVRQGRLRHAVLSVWRN